MAIVRPGGRPSGNRIIADITQANVTSPSRAPSQTTISDPGRAPPAKRLSYPYAPDRYTGPKSAPATPKSQPIGPPARLTTSSDPTMANDSSESGTRMSGPK